MHDSLSTPRHDVEQVILLDGDGNPAGVADKATVHNHHTPLHLAFSCYIFNDVGELLVTRRALSKRTWPGVWTNSCCGHPMPGERMADAVGRRAHTELGLPITDLVCALPDFRYRAESTDGTVENEICPVYLARSTAAPSPSSSEVADWIWVPWPRFTQLAANTPWAVSPWAALQAPRLAEHGVPGGNP